MYNEGLDVRIGRKYIPAQRGRAPCWRNAPSIVHAKRGRWLYSIRWGAISPKSYRPDGLSCARAVGRRPPPSNVNSAISGEILFLLF